MLFFLLYFNRLFATVLSYGVRAYTWHYYRAYVDIQALQVSLLGGRVFFKGIRYHGVNETIFIHGGFVTWRYWKHAVKRTDLSNLSEGDGTSDQDDGLGEQGGLGKADGLSCRIAAKVYGLEWFVYNRTPAYNDILAGFNVPNDDDDISSPLLSRTGSWREKYAEDGTGKVKENQPSVSSSSGNRHETGDSPGQEEEEGSDEEPRRSLSDPGSNQEIGDSLSRLLYLLPVRVACDKGAIVMGNQNTKSVLTVTFDSATSFVEASKAGPLDLYRQIFSFHLRHPIVQMRPNPDFKQNQIAGAKGLISNQEDRRAPRRKRDRIFNYQRQKRRAWESIRVLIPYFQTSVESFHSPDKQADLSAKNQGEAPSDFRWTGLSRYLDENSQDVYDEWNNVEYGRFSTILDSPNVTISYFWDIPGCVRSSNASSFSSVRRSSPDINGSPPPEWGIDVKLEGGSINYGPWADRERAGLQNVFFPNSYRSSEPARRLLPGELRRNTVFKLRIEFNDKVTLRIPTREQSKDWQWKGRGNATKGASKVKERQGRQSRKKEGEKGHIGPDIRPFGWLSLRVAADSTITYTMDMVAAQTGYTSKLDLDLRESRMSSSVNHGTLWQCPRQLITCDLSTPLSWNSLRTWTFGVHNESMELFLLRDHVFLLIDLISDWGSGPPPDYWTYVPFIYKLNLSFADVQLFVNVNDLNIISNPSDLEDNRFLLIKAGELTSDVTIPLNKFKPEQNTVGFSVNASDASIDFLTPLWDTFHSFMRDKSTASLQSLAIDGSYNYFLSTSPELTDTLVLNIDGFSPKLYLFGVLIHYFMTIKENYFGEEMHFKTLEEFQELAYAGKPPDPCHGMDPHRKSNDLDVIVHVFVDKPCALLPAGLYDHSKCTRLTADGLEADLRFTNYYMDLHFSLPPTKAALESCQDGDSPVISDPQLFLDSVIVHGHRLFGLPPAEPTYVCNWDFDVGKIVGECSPEFMSCLLAGLQSFDMSFDNFENALPPPVPISLHDVTFLRANIGSLHVSILLEDTAFILSSAPLTATFNDLKDDRFTKRLSLLIPEITVAAVDLNSVASSQKRNATVAPLALAQATIKFRMAQRDSAIGELRRLQQDHIRIHDKRTQRTPWLLFDFDDDLGPNSSYTNSDGTMPLPALAIPSLPEPLLKGRPLELSFGYRPPTRSDTSSRSFLVDRDDNSLRSVRKRPKRTSPSLASENESIEQMMHRPDQIQRGNSSTNISLKAPAPGSLLESAGSWVMPNFSLYKVVLDKSQLPSRHVTSNEEDREDFASTSLDPMFSPYEDEKRTNTNLACEIPGGLKGFCTPRFLLAVSTLAGRLQPRHPAEVIDAIQKDIVSDIIGYEKSLNKARKSTSFAIRVPVILFKLVNSPPPVGSSEADHLDEYNVEVSHLKTEFRTRVERKEGDLISGISESATVHASARKLLVSIDGGRANVYEERAKLSCLLRDMDFWVVTEPSVRSRLQMQGFDTLTSTKSVEHLASLVHRTTTMLDSVTSGFQQNSSSSTRRLHFLFYSLTQEIADIQDPPFLTRISYVLRVAPSHFRQHDSWKIISRLRNTYNKLSPDKQIELSRCLSKDMPLPVDARTAMISSFNQWRTVDPVDVEQSYLMRKTWNDSNSAPETAQKPMSFSLVVGLLRFSIDPGSKESDYTVENLLTAFSFGPRKNENEEEAKEKPKNVAILQLYCSAVSLRLRWEIVNLVEGLMKTMSSVTLQSAQHAEAANEQTEEGSELEIQAAFGADAGSITLDGINIELALVGKSLRGSLAYHLEEAEKRKDLSLLLSAGACSSEIFSHSKSLMLWKIGDPYVYGSRISQESETEITNELKLAGSCKRLRYEMQEDPINLTHTADRVIADEVHYIHQLVNDISPPQSSEKPEKPAVAEKQEENKLQAALFLDDYELNFRLLPSLVYTISGEVARMSVMPREQSKVEVDFDIKQNSHIFSSTSGDDTWHALSALEFPPINGRVVASTSPKRTNVEVDVTIELIYLDASAVRSLLGALTGPEISHLVADVKQNVDVLQAHLSDILASDKPPVQQKEVSEGPEILYNAHLTMAGTQIHVTAPGLSGKEHSTDMGLSLGMIRMRLDNGFENGNPIEYPEFRFDASQIRFDLRRKEESGSRSYGSFALGTRLVGTSVQQENGESTRVYHLGSKDFDIELYPESAALVVDIAAHLQERIKTLDLSYGVQRLKKLRQRGHTESRTKPPETPGIQIHDESGSEVFFKAIYSLDIYSIQVAWNMASAPSTKSGRRPDDLVFSIKRVELSNKKRNAAKLRIEDMQLQMVPDSMSRRQRSLTSALLPEVVFNVAYTSSGKDVRVAFQAAGKSLDLRATSDFILPASMIGDTIASASQTLREANSVLGPKLASDSNDNQSNTAPSKERNLFGNKRLRSVLVDVDFAGAIVSLQGRHISDQQTMMTATQKGSRFAEGKYGQYVQGDPATTATLRAPGVALKVQFDDNGVDDPALNAELKVDASTNVLYPTLVPLIKQMTATVKELIGEKERPRRPSTAPKLQTQKLVQETTLSTSDPHSILGRCRANVGLLICKQEFSLSCQPIARVAATARFNSVYVTVNTVQSDDHGRFLSLLVAFNSLEASVKHVYSNESTASFEVKSIMMSLMNSKHVSNKKGISAILNITPVKVSLNGKQVQDLLLFREIWVPSDDEPRAKPAFQPEPTDSQPYIVQRYHQVASTSAFPWNAAIAVEKIEMQLDLGSTLGKAQFSIDDMWLSSKKTSDRKQTLCINFGDISVDSKGRMSGLVELRTLKVHTSIQWQDETPGSAKTPLIQASASFDELQAKTSFDYQPFLAARITMFSFLMYNVTGSGSTSERLFSILEGDEMHIYCTTLTASQSLALFQAWQRLVQDKQAAYAASLREVERYLRRRTSMATDKLDSEVKDIAKKVDKKDEKSPISLHTGVVVTIRTVHIGAFPGSFFDNQILRLEAHNAQAHFDVSMENGKIHSVLGLTLGQLRVALSGISRPSYVDIEELSVKDITRRANDSRGGTILKVPQLIASMETWQQPGLHEIEYIFRSTFQGKVDVGWNYSRISFIRDMWESHSRTLTSRLGKPLPPSAVRIEGGPSSEGSREKHEQEKITAVVNVPQSKYTYVPLQMPIIETPQLRDMGEATPPLEWIGLQRDKLPNVTHHIIIVTLLEVAREVEDAYGKILGST